jgi:Tfp pilus assembly protein PilF
MTKKATHNSTYPKVAVQWLNQALCFYQSLCLIDSEVLRNRHLRVAAKRWQKILTKTLTLNTN